MKLNLVENAYVGGLFPKIPDRVSGQDTLLVSADGIARKVDDHLTTKDIRKANYNKVVRVPTAPFSLDVKFKSVSKNKPYEFDVVVGVECKVNDSVAYYTNRALYDISDSISTALSRIVTPIAKAFELTDDSIDDAIYKKLSEHGYTLESLGITYTVHSADAEPDSNAEKFVKQMTDSTLNTRVEEHKAIQAERLTARNMESAIMRQVSEGKLDMKTALEQLSASNRQEGYNRLEDIERLVAFVRNLQEKNLITDDEAGQRINEFLGALPASLPNANMGKPMAMNAPQLEAKSVTSDETIGELLPDEENS
jgi:hypothetical protein